MRLLTITLITGLLLTGCGGASSSPTSPSPTPTPSPTPAPTPAPAPVATSLSGVITTSNSVRLSGVTVKFLDGANAGLTTTSIADGSYRFDNLTASNSNMSASAPAFAEVRSGLAVTGATTLNFSIFTSVPWERHGGGDDVWTRPIWVQRVSVHGVYTGSSHNFVLRCGSTLLVNEILGTFGSFRTTYDGVLNVPTSCGTQMNTEISSGVQWQVVEQR